MKYTCTKHYGHDLGLSCVFRQWNAESHCRHLHGYALAVTLEFAADELDDNGWVVDFGSLGAVRSYLQQTFDHKVLVADDDPDKDLLLALQAKGIAEVLIVEQTGCEAFARMIAEGVGSRIRSPRARLVSVTVSEHAANSATVKV